MAFIKKQSLIVIPFYNEESRIIKKTYKDAFSRYGDFDFLLVDDSSNDQTPAILDSFSENFNNVIALKLNINSGKAQAIRAGVLSMNTETYDFVAYLDADLATPFEEIINLINYISSRKDIMVVMGARIKLLGNGVHRSLLRHYFGRIFATIISQIVLKVPVYDTQCGAKVFDAKLAKALFEKPFETKWIFDVELLLRYKALDANFHKKIVELPLNTWEEKEKSKIKPHEFLLFPFQLLKIYVKYV